MRLTCGLAALALALSGCGGPDAEQIIASDPANVYAAFDQALTQSDVDGTIGSGPKAVPYSVTLTRTANQRLDLTVLIDGKPAGAADFSFVPHGDGSQTLVTANVDVDLALLGRKFGTTPDNQVAGVPPLAWNAGVRRMLRNAADRIANGAPLDTGQTLFKSSLDSGIGRKRDIS